MSHTTKNIVTLIAVAAIVVTLSTQSEAGCHGHGGGGFSISIGRSSSYNNYQPRYQTNYRQPTYVAPPRPVQTYPQQPISQPGAPIGQPQQGQPFGQPQQAQQGQPFGQPQQPIQQGQPQQQAQQPQGAAGQPQQAQQQNPAAQPQTQAPASAETSALEALGGFAPPQSEASTPVSDNSQLPAHVGRWSATLSNGGRIQLDLNANGSFNWSAMNKEGSTSSFQGTYEINNGSLTLIRSTDNQKLAGSLQTSGNDAFSFQLADQKAAKLEFVRA